MKKISNEIFDEEKEEVNNIKPIPFPKTTIEKPDRNDFFNLNKIPQSTNNRKKAYDLMKKNILSNSEVQNLNNSKTIAELPENKINTQYQDKRETNLIGYEDGNAENSFQKNNRSSLKNKQVEPNKYNPFVNLSYVLGTNLNLPNLSEHNLDELICFHKKDKWIAHLNQNLIVIENFDEIYEENYNRRVSVSGQSNSRQIILNEISKNYYLNSLKISENGRILMAYSKQGEQKERDTNITNNKIKTSYPIILFFSYNNESLNNIENTTDQKVTFSLINKIKLKHSNIISCEISTQNNLCIVLSNNKPDETFVSILDFYHNEILTTTVISISYKSIKWNPFLTNFEFSSLSNYQYTFWRFNTNDITLQYQHGDILRKDDIKNNSVFTCMEFTPPLGAFSTILLLIAVSNGQIMGVDTKTNSVVVQSTLQDTIISKIDCTLKFINLIHSNKISSIKLPTGIFDISNILQINEQSNLSQNFSTLELDSEIISYNSDIITSNAISLTRKSSLFCITYSEKEISSFRLFSFIESGQEILQAKISNRNIESQIYSLRKIDYDNLQFEDISRMKELKMNQFILITSHKKGIIKIWTIPEYQILSTLEVCTEEILTFDISPNDMTLVVSYSSGFLRFFDLSQDLFLGKFRSISYQPYKIIKFTPDKFFLFAVDLADTVYLIKVEDYLPKNFTVQVHKIMELPGNVLEFKLSVIESFNKFLVNLDNVYLHVYNRKFTNILKNLSYDNSIPVFYLQDKFNPDEYFRLNENRTAEKNCDEFYKYEFAQLVNEKNLIYIMSHARAIIMIRNFESHTIDKIVKFSQSPYYFCLSPYMNYYLYVFKSRLRVSREFVEDGKDFETTCDLSNLPKKNSYCLSSNGKYFVICSENIIYFYNINQN